MVCFVHFDLEMCFAPQPRAFFHLSTNVLRFSEVTFRPSGAPNHWKNTVSRFSYLFVHLHLLSSLSFSSLILSLLLFSYLTLPTSAFPSVHIVGSLTSKLPSIINDPFRYLSEGTVLDCPLPGAYVGHRFGCRLQFSSFK